MSPSGGAARPRLRAALVVGLAWTVALLAPMLTSPTTASVMAAAVAATVTAVVATGRFLVTPAGTPLVLGRRRAGDAPALRAGRVTDSPHHPLRPRAPGLV